LWVLERTLDVGYCSPKKSPVLIALIISFYPEVHPSFRNPKDLMFLSAKVGDFELDTHQTISQGIMSIDENTFFPLFGDTGI
jgi:hypothetical protein